MCHLSFVAILVLYVFGTLLGADVSECPQNVQSMRYLHPYQDSCVLLVKDPQSWDVAHGICQNLGGDLVTIKDAKKQSFVFSYLSVDNWKDDTLWIGANDQKYEGEWRWADGTRLIYEHFASGQGSNHNSGFFWASGGGEDCALLKRNDAGQWHDYPCSRRHPYACEFAKTHIPTTSSPVLKTTLEQLIRTSTKEGPSTVETFVTASLTTAKPSTAVPIKTTSLPTSMKTSNAVISQSAVMKIKSTTSQQPPIVKTTMKITPSTKPPSPTTTPTPTPTTPPPPTTTTTPTTPPTTQPPPAIFGRRKR